MEQVRKGFKRILVVISVSIFIIGCSAVMFPLHKNAQEIKRKYQNNIENYKAAAEVEHKWISQNQVSNGALLFYKEESGTANVNPYFSSIAAKALLGKTFDNDDKKVAYRYLNWYFLHLNSSEQDKVNGSGTIYDYKIVMKNSSIVSEKSMKKYDSVDSYAASFLMLLNAYYEKTEDTEYVIAHMDKISMVIQAMLNTIDSDGLSKTDKTIGIKYLMDNAEVNMALKDTIKLLERLSKKEKYRNSAYYDQGISLMDKIKEALLKNTAAIENNLWNQADYHYEIGLNKDNKKIDFAGWNNFYADAIAQVFPIAFGVVDPESERARKLYETFCREYKWENFQHFIDKDTGFYWCVLSYVGALMGDEKRVDQFISYYQRRVAINHDYPIYVGDSGWFIMACDKMIEINEKKIKKTGFLKLSKE